MSEITFFAKTNFRNREKVFGIKRDDRRRHMYIIGKTGMGKTNLLEYLAIQDIRNGRGIAYIDPHGDTAEKLLKAVPSTRINDVIYFNPADQEFPIAFNVMYDINPSTRHLTASGLVGVFKKIWADSWGPRLEHILRNAILTLIEYPNSTLLGVLKILVDDGYRKMVTSKIDDQVVRNFWNKEFAGYSEKLLRHVVHDQPPADLFHGDALRLAKRVCPDLRLGLLQLLETRQRAPPELLGPEGGDVHEEETALDGWSLDGLRGLFDGLWILKVFNHNTPAYSAARRQASLFASGAPQRGRQGHSRLCPYPASPRFSGPLLCFSVPQ